VDRFLLEKNSTKIGLFCKGDPTIYRAYSLCRFHIRLCVRARAPVFLHLFVSTSASPSASTSAVAYAFATVSVFLRCTNPMIVYACWWLVWCSDLTVPLLAMGGPSTNHPLSTFIWWAFTFRCIGPWLVFHSMKKLRGKTFCCYCESCWRIFLRNVSYNRVAWHIRMSREYMSTAFLVFTVFATVVDKHTRHAESGLKVLLQSRHIPMDESCDT